MNKYILIGMFCVLFISPVLVSAITVTNEGFALVLRQLLFEQFSGSTNTSLNLSNTQGLLQFYLTHVTKPTIDLSQNLPSGESVSELFNTASQKLADKNINIKDE